MNNSLVLANIIQGLPSSIAMLDNDHNFLAVSKEWNSLSLQDESKVGESLYQFWPQDQEKWKDILAKVFSGEAVENARDQVTCGDDDIYIKWSATPIWDSKSETVESAILFVENITQQIVTEYTLNHSEKMIALGEMAGGIAHEINNPLNIISAGAEVLDFLYQKGEVDYDKISKTLLTIKNTTFRISKIVNALKTFSRSAEDEVFELHQIDKIVQESLNLCLEKLKMSGVEIKNTIEKDIEVTCRPVEISQILINLIHNSGDALDELKGEKWIEISAESDNHSSSIIVTDSGSGIAPKVAKKMMNPFFTTKQVGKGTGLGLSISKKIAERNNAELIYNNQSPQTQFIIKFKKSS